jgi:hypothetical protein
MVRAAGVVLAVVAAISGSALAAYLTARAIRSHTSEARTRGVPSPAPAPSVFSDLSAAPTVGAAAIGALTSRETPLSTEGPPASSRTIELAPPSRLALGTPRRQHRSPAASQPVIAATSERAPSPSSAIDPVALEAAELARGIAQKQRGELALAASTLERYRSSHPHGLFVAEATLAQLDAELGLGRKAEALALLQHLGDSPTMPRRDELRLLRAELESQTGQCAAALPAFENALNAPALAERALYGRANCLRALGRPDESRRAFEAFLARYPQGRLAIDARRALGRAELEH